ncbi:MAG: porin [Candidatus Latescibacterota bacterium]
MSHAAPCVAPRRGPGERGLPTHLLSNRDLGLQLYGDLARGRVSYAIGVFNGVVDAGSGDSDTNDGKDVAVRVFAHPFRNRPASPLRELGLGLAGTLGRQEGALPAYRAPGQVSFFTYTDTTTVDGRRLTPQAYWYAGRLGLLGEYAVSRQKVRRQAVAARLRHTAWQVAASYVLTGEASTYRGVTPRAPFDPEKSQWGALEAAARVHRLTLDRDAFPAFANPARSARTATAWSAGLNWHLSRNAKLNLDYEETRFTGVAPAGDDRKLEKILFHRFQVAF